MKYKDALKKIDKNHVCPFCEEQKVYILESTKYCYVTPPRAPYVEDHLLIVPQRHVVLLQDLNHEELQDIFEIIEKWTEKLHKYHSDVNLLCRDGLLGGKAGKSINHLHFHLIPDAEVTTKNNLELEREFYEDDVFGDMVSQIKEKLL